MKSDRDLGSKKFAEITTLQIADWKLSSIGEL